MNGSYNKEFCDERHKNLKETIDEMKSDITSIANILRESTDALHTKINWFYVIAIITLAGVIANFVK